MNYVIKNLHYALTVSDKGAEMVSLKRDTGAELMWQCEDEELWCDHAPLLFPVCGQLKGKGFYYKGVRYDMGGHGFIKNAIFTPVLTEESKLVLTTSSSEETKKIYPFDFTLTATYELCDDKILFSVSVKNDGNEPLPHMFGWHPGFVLPTDSGCDIEDYAIRFRGDYEKLTWTPLQHGCFARPYGEDYPIKDSKYILSEDEIYKNDTMIFSDCGSSVELSAKDGGFKLNMSWSDNLPYLCVWKEPLNDAKFICLEPWTGTPNDGEVEEDFETRKMERLLPGNEAVYSYELSFEF